MADIIEHSSSVPESPSANLDPLQFPDMDLRPLVIADASQLCSLHSAQHILELISSFGVKKIISCSAVNSQCEADRIYQGIDERNMTHSLAHLKRDFIIFILALLQESLRIIRINQRQSPFLVVEHQIIVLVNIISDQSINISPFLQMRKVRCHNLYLVCPYSVEIKGINSNDILAAADFSIDILG